MDRCRVCDSPGVREVLDLGDVPLANSFRLPEAAGEPEPTYRLGLQWCPTCGIAQIPELVDPEILFRHYVYTPSASSTWRAHCDELASWLWDRSGRRPQAFVVEPASNDGCLLQAIRQRMSRVLGVEPAEDIAVQARADGIPTRIAFFSESTAVQIRGEHGLADIIVGTNVLAHVPDILDFLRGAARLLAPDGIFVIEAPYLVDLVDQVAYDTIYHEHVSYLSVTALRRILPMAGLTLTDVERTPVHGGSIRFTGQVEGAPAKDTVEQFVVMERERGYEDGRALADFAERVEGLRIDLVDVVRRLRGEGRTVAAYGATAKGNTLLTTCRIGHDDVRYVIDKNPRKQGLLTPGSGIPVVGPERLEDDPVDVLLLLAWNLRDEIIREQTAFARRGGRFLVPIPRPMLLDASSRP